MIKNTNPKIFIHIGFPKSGSSFLQKHLNLINKDDYKIFLNYSKVVQLILEYFKAQNAGIKKEILNIIKNEKAKNIILSSEAFVDHQNNHFRDTSKRYQLLEELFNKPNYIIFYREPSAIIYSHFLQGLAKSNSLIFQNYIDENKNDFKNKTHYSNMVQGLDYRIYNYNDILKDYLKIKNRVLFVNYDNFFKEKNSDLLNNFIGLDIEFNWNNKINYSFKKLIYLEFYNKYLIYKLIKVFYLKINKFFYKFNNHREVSLKILVLIKFLNKFTQKKYLNKIDDNHQNLLKQIKDYHSKSYDEFKNECLKNVIK